MRMTVKDTFAFNSLIKLKNDDWLIKQRVAGKVVAGALQLLEKAIQEKTTKSLNELNNIAEIYINQHDCICTFKNYKGFPAGVCISVNSQLVHGIPTDYKLQDGDVVSFDLGATFNGAIADSALTCIYGIPKSELHSKLIKATEDALLKGIEAITIGKKIGCIGNAIAKHAKLMGFSVVEQYGGHGLDWNVPHASPFVASKADVNEGIRIQPGLAIAIEPQLTNGSTKTWVDKDGWTVWCEAEISAHFEHSVFVHENYVEIITNRDSL